VLAAITRLGLQVDLPEVFDRFIGSRRFGDKFRSQAVLLVRNNHHDDDMAGRSAAATESANPAPASPMATGYRRGEGGFD